MSKFKKAGPLIYPEDTPETKAIINWLRDQDICACIDGDPRLSKVLNLADELSGASGRSRGIMAAHSDLMAEVVHGTGLLTGLNR